ncbi:hypothetical protein ZEAMMB73_Zm00001d035217 [Zea mays]|uniref:Uncharacterized protein n=1 Tax=Zea mays TaxID=4577 RepID=A0A1D6LF23_MAIZE|nr:hypothetical protein ZEAMMB73_Zm00001d035217 [Zea mays]AQK78543.1 hypothetical protein ZEAMMB73_Zm00001d035217 [Zea mays]
MMTPVRSVRTRIIPSGRSWCRTVCARHSLNMRNTKSKQESSK